VPSM